MDRCPVQDYKSGKWIYIIFDLFDENQASAIYYSSMGDLSSIGSFTVILLK